MKSEAQLFREYILNSKCPQFDAHVYPFIKNYLGNIEMTDIPTTSLQLSFSDVANIILEHINSQLSETDLPRFNNVDILDIPSSKSVTIPIHSIVFTLTP